MKRYSIYVSGCFDGDGQIEIDKVREQFRAFGCEMHVRNMSKMVTNSDLDVIGHEVVSMPYVLLNGMCRGIGEGRLRDLIWRLGRVLTRDGGAEAHFAVCVDKIPTKDGAESIKCRIGGEREFKSVFADEDEHTGCGVAAGSGISAAECGLMGECELADECEAIVMRDFPVGHESEGELDLKCKAVGDVFSLVRDIEQSRRSLLERGMYFGLYNAHVFFFDRTKGRFAELDIDEEIRRRIEE